MRTAASPGLFATTVAAALFVAVALAAQHSYATLGDPALVTGWSLFALLLFLALFNVRKRLSMLPLLRARWWTPAHVGGGVLALGLFWLHTGSLWPYGAYERFLAGAFYLVSVSGLVGQLFNRVYPRRLTETDVEIIYERIPAEIARVRAQAEAVMLDCLRETGADTLGRYYIETLDWYLRRPRFLFNCLWGGRRGTNWVNRRLATVRRYLGDAEAKHLRRLADLMHHKSRIDVHYAIQRVLKGWLLLHVPAAAATVVLSVWHVLLVHVYAL